MDILQKLAEAARVRVGRDKATLPQDALMALCGAGPREAPAGGTEPPAFESALREAGMSFICEIKRASPSRGVITEDFDALDIARDYFDAGADCISVLTEPEYFLGSSAYLRDVAAAVPLPVLRKDFTVDEYQIYQARALGSSAVLLICAILDAASLREFIELSEELGLTALTEVHDGRELSMALGAGARVVGVNNRDLKTFTVDPLNCLRLRELTPPGVAFVAESGITCRADVVRLEQNGVDAVLVGEALMRAPDRRAALRELRGR
ncbi:MAG: indole-3-glycerol phosphate synthase TrpC [Oscillospiraceae bacterium]|jgi:indole-3-glycerol phosphate synthase|nr:indole-3-glycerol phosphate synthase TrpC [Oscillospiraceae bacterium]